MAASLLRYSCENALFFLANLALQLFSAALRQIEKLAWETSSCTFYGNIGTARTLEIEFI